MSSAAISARLLGHLAFVGPGAGDRALEADHNGVLLGRAAGDREGDRGNVQRARTGFSSNCPPFRDGARAVLRPAIRPAASRLYSRQPHRASRKKAPAGGRAAAVGRRGAVGPRQRGNRRAAPGDGRPAVADQATRVTTTKVKRSGGGRPRLYDAQVQRVVVNLWRRLGYLCGKRLVPILRRCIPSIRRDRFLRPSAEVCRALAHISAATIDRLLKPARQKLRLKGGCHTRRSSGLLAMIPVRTFGDFSSVEPGHVQLDTVGHDGGISSGDYTFTLTLSDVCTGWTERRAVKNRASRWITDAVNEMRKAMPFPVKHLHPDNGSEFININLYRYCKTNKIGLSRSRAGRKNDNCWVEQKNFDTVRKLVGYGRYASPEALEALNGLYRVQGVLQNYVLPSMKLRDENENRQPYPEALRQTDDPGATGARAQGHQQRGEGRGSQDQRRHRSPCSRRRGGCIAGQGAGAGRGLTFTAGGRRGLRMSDPTIGVRPAKARGVFSRGYPSATCPRRTSCASAPPRVGPVRLSSGLVAPLARAGVGWLSVTPFNEALHASELAARRRICGLSDSARDEIVGPWWFLLGGVPEVPAFDAAVPAGPPLLAGDLAAARRWFGDLPHRLLARREEDAALIDEALREGYAVDEVDGAYVLAGPATEVPKPPGLEVVEAISPALLEDYGRIGWAAAGLAWVGIAIARRALALGFVPLLGLCEGAPCASSLAAVTPERGPGGETVVGVCNVAVEGRFRRRGIGSYMTAAALSAGRGRGAAIGYLRARPGVERLYSRLGFRKVYDYLSLRSPR